MHTTAILPQPHYNAHQTKVTKLHSPPTTLQRHLTFQTMPQHCTFSQPSTAATDTAATAAFAAAKACTAVTEASPITATLKHHTAVPNLCINPASHTNLLSTETILICSHTAPLQSHSTNTATATTLQHYCNHSFLLPAPSLPKPYCITAHCLPLCTAQLNHCSNLLQPQFIHCTPV